MPDKSTDRAKEEQKRLGNVVAFFKNAETKYPELAQQLPALLSGILARNSFDPSALIKNESNINGGLAYLGSWLSQTGFEGFNVYDLSLYDIGIQTGAPLKVPLPSRNDFFAKSKVDPANHQQLQDAMVDLSRTIGLALEVGYKPKQVLGALFIQSTARVGDERAETSLPTREMLIKASGNKLSEVNQILNRWVQGK